jgi:hypothetical protein
MNRNTDTGKEMVIGIDIDMDMALVTDKDTEKDMVT